MISFRNYKSTDYEELKVLLKEADLFADTWESEENLSGMIKNNPESIILAVNENEIVGNLFLVNYGIKIALIFRLTVKTKYRNQGIASKLLVYTEEVAKRQGIIEVCLFADAENEELRNFYKKREYISSDHPYYSMWKELK